VDTFLAQSEDRRAATTAALAFIGLTSQQIASLVMTLCAASLLALSEYGAFMLAVVFVEFATVLTYSGFFHFTVQSRHADDQVHTTMFWTILGIGLFTGVILGLIAHPAAQVFQAPELAPLLLGFAFLQPFAAIIAWASACLNRSERLRAYFSCLATSNFSALICGVALLLIWPSIYALLVYRAVRITIGLALFCKAIQIKPRFTFSVTIFKEAAAFSIGLYGTRLLGFFSNFGTDLILAYVFSTSESGLFRIANRLASAAIDIVAQPLRSFALKSFGAAARKRQEFHFELLAFASAGYFLSGGVAVTIIGLGPVLIAAFFQPEYTMVVPAFYALCLRWALAFGHNLVEPVFSALSKNTRGMQHHLIWTSAICAVSILLAPQGIFALSLGQCTVSLLSTLAAFWIFKSRRKINTPILLRKLATASLVLLGFGLCFLSSLCLLKTYITDPKSLLFFGLITALLFAILATTIAVNFKVVSPRIFQSR